jgi:hypothetical protein
VNELGSDEELFLLLPPPPVDDDDDDDLCRLRTTPATIPPMATMATTATVPHNQNLDLCDEAFSWGAYDEGFSPAASSFIAAYCSRSRSA